ncbi:D-isomer specific 2-hydroxyacid dehydrogenase family protein [Microlunatus panaciterrae]|uniref:Phosphoglycerate dehydrogenase-like enzyme n=1 Tax=Microlunatus panaciterrae TaxID=400768 RepID=A0ABS2RMC3_9ACTN|nr:D-isomer specific 2-hydroxyacid dehydrogenase family protein [Microlunatus panaciterrae]MBM7799084.1 phosphoglycerate dehydrogenase-like enzyme [Microlunatus panaciterrae]
MTTAIDRPRIMIGPNAAHVLPEAVERAGGVVVAPGEVADGLVWAGFEGEADIQAALSAPDLRWVQLPGAGVDGFVGKVDFHDGRVWTCAKGSFAEPVAEHALALTLAGLRDLPERVRARSWGAQKATMLYDLNVTVVGAGGIAQEFMRLIAPFRTRVTVVRNTDQPLPGADRTLTLAQLDEALPDADVVMLAAALTEQTRGMFAARQFELMKPTAWLINIARGPIVVTDDLVTALRTGAIAGAGIDVTDPEPLPDGHPLWELDNCLITPHTADTFEMIQPMLATRVEENVRLLREGAPLAGVVDPDKSY